MSLHLIIDRLPAAEDQKKKLLAILLSADQAVSEFESKREYCEKQGWYLDTNPEAHKRQLQRAALHILVSAHGMHNFAEIAYWM